MKILVGTTDKLQLITSAAAAIDVVASFVDSTGAAGSSVTPGCTPTAIVTATTTDILATPASSTFRNLKGLSIRNKDAALSCDVTVQLNRSATLYEMHKTTLQIGECLEYEEGVGFYKLASTGKLDTKLHVANDVTFATAATFADVTGLTVALKSGKNYSFEAHLYHISNATTTGAQFGVNIGAAPTLLQIATIDTVTGSVTAGVMSTGATATRDTAATAQTTGSAAITLGILSGNITPSADGTFAIRATSEVTVASGLIVKAGSWLRIWENDG